MNEWQGLIKLRELVINHLDWIAMKEKRLLDDNERFEKKSCEDDIKRFKIYSRANI